MSIIVPGAGRFKFCPLNNFPPKAFIYSNLNYYYPITSNLRFKIKAKPQNPPKSPKTTVNTDLFVISRILTIHTKLRFEDGLLLTEIESSGWII